MFLSLSERAECGPKYFPGAFEALSLQIQILYCGGLTQIDIWVKGFTCAAWPDFLTRY